MLRERRQRKRSVQAPGSYCEMQIQPHSQMRQSSTRVSRPQMVSAPSRLAARSTRQTYGWSKCSSAGTQLGGRAHVHRMQRKIQVHCTIVQSWSLRSRFRSPSWEVSVADSTTQCKRSMRSTASPRWCIAWQCWIAVAASASSLPASRRSCPHHGTGTGSASCPCSPIRLQVLGHVIGFPQVVLPILHRPRPRPCLRLNSRHIALYRGDSSGTWAQDLISDLEGS